MCRGLLFYIYGAMLMFCVHFEYVRVLFMFCLFWGYFKLLLWFISCAISFIYYFHFSMYLEYYLFDLSDNAMC